MPHCRALGILAALAACSGSSELAPGPAPADGYQQAVRVAVARLLEANYELSQPLDCRFAAPAPGWVARWHWEPQTDGYVHSAGKVRGWCIDFWFTPHYVGYPAQPEAHRMAFFADGRLRGIFARGDGRAPIGLDRWDAVWVDHTWQGAAAPAK